MTAFFRVRRFTRRTRLVSSLLTVSLARLQMGATQPCGALPRSEQLAVAQTAELPEGFGLKPLSTRTEARLCVYCLVRNAGFEPATNRVEVDSSTTELKTPVPLRRARLSRFIAFWATKYNTPNVVHLPAT